MRVSSFDGTASIFEGIGMEPQNYIVHGHKAEEGQFPWHVSIARPDTEDRNLFHIAGGVVVSSNFVLTAAHVVVPLQEYHLRFNSLELWSGGETQISHNAIWHEKYDPDTLQNNIALILLAQTIQIGPNSPIQALRLPCSDDVRPSLVGQRARLSGHGVNEKGQISTQLRFIDLQVIDNRSCRAFFHNRVSSNVLCAVGWFRRRENACGGDSGGALVIRRNGEWVPIGLTSFGALNQCANGFPTGYTRLASYVEWIEENSGINTGCTNEGKPEISFS